MDVDPYRISVEQSNLFDLQEAISNRFEFLSFVWNAAEALASPDMAVRSSGLECLVDFDAVRSSPLIAFLLTTQITEPDIAQRTRVVQVLAEACSSNGNGSHASETVLGGLVAALSQMRTREIFAILQVAEHEPSAAECVACLLDLNPFAGEHLAGILANRQNPLTIRKQAARYIGQIGYLDALPTLERLAARLEARKNGAADTIPLDQNNDEGSLLPYLKDALAALQSP